MAQDRRVTPRVLTIAGSDPSGGAGLQADLKAFTVLRTYGLGVVTALTVQNTTGVAAVEPVDPALVRRQIDAVATDIRIDAAKTGMLATGAIVRTVADAVRAHRLQRLVVDPVLSSGGGVALLDADGRRALLDDLIPLARLVTPNAPEAAALLGMRVDGVADLEKAARRLVGLGAGAALVKGGHLAGAESIDVLFDGSSGREFRAPRLETRHSHGTGCLLSAAVAAGLAAGASLPDAVETAKRFVTAAIAGGFPLGSGNGPADALAWAGDPPRPPSNAAQGD